MGNLNPFSDNKAQNNTQSQTQRSINPSQISSDTYKYYQNKTTTPKTQISQPKNNIMNKPKMEIKNKTIEPKIKNEKTTPSIKPKNEIHINKETTKITTINIKKPKKNKINNISNNIQKNEIIINNNKVQEKQKNNTNTISTNENRINNYIDNNNYYNNNNYYDYNQEEEYYEDDDYYEEEEYYEEDEYYDDDYYNNDYYYNNNNYNYDNNDNNTQMIFNNSESFTGMVDKTINPYPTQEINDEEIYVLMIAEKPSIAKTISKILGGNNLIDRSKEKGWCYYEFDGEFKGIYAHFIVSAVSGHIYQAEFPEDYRSFNIDPYDLFDSPIEKVESDENSHLNIEWLNEISKGVDILCLWLDCDREGENICYEVIHNVLPNMNQKEYQQIYRAIFSSLAENDIINSFKNISNYPDNNLSLSVDARQIIDLKVGVSITRFLTNSLFDYLPENIGNDCISYGPCQTPTLYFCVKREREIEEENNKYYKIYITLKSNNLELVICLNDEFSNENEVENIKNKLLKMQKIKIEKVNWETRIKSHPQGLNTATLLKISSLYLKNSPQTTMKLAQNLYMLGAITYPRTETTYYSPSTNFGDNLYYLGCDELIDYVKGNLDNINEYGIDEGDHPPITPIGINYSKYSSRLTEKQNDLYNLICDYYFASLSPDMEYNTVTYEFKIGNKIYNATSHVIENEGYSEYFDYELKDFNYDRNYLEENYVYDIIKVEYEEQVKDDYITEAELIEEMEKNKIGTDASMSIHIENIVKRGYVTVTEDRRLIPTDLGRALIEGLEEVEPELVLPKNRAKIENFVSQLAEGKTSYKNVLDNAINFYKNKYTNLYNGIDTIFEAFRRYFDMADDYYYEN